MEMRHISDNELDRYLDLNQLDLEIHMISVKEKPNVPHTLILVKRRLTGAIMIQQVFEGIPSDEEIINLIKPYMRDKLLNSLI